MLHSRLLLWWQQDKNGKEGREETEVDNDSLCSVHLLVIMVGNAYATVTLCIYLFSLFRTCFL